MFVAAMAALEHQRNVELIREGIADMEAGRTIPLDEAMDRIRNALLLRKDNESLR
jgi:predicted transcriptional regulator